jgi:uncharacterized protein (TIGR02001 family)
MRKSLLFVAVLGALATSQVVMAEEAAAEKSPHSVSYNVGLFSQYIFRGLTQTDSTPALQGGVDYSHSSGFYLGGWASNVSWPRDDYFDNTFYKSGGSLEIDVYGGYKTELGKTGLTLDVGALQYYYPGRRTGGDFAMAKINTTEVYGALSYSWLQAKYSQVVSKDAWGWGKYKVEGEKSGSNADGTYYAELNLNVPVGELVKLNYLNGVSALAHIGYQDFAGKENEYASFTDYKLGLQKSFENGVNVGAFWTTTNASDRAWTYDGQNIGRSTGTLYVQKTF